MKSGTATEGTGDTDWLGATAAQEVAVLRKKKGPDPTVGKATTKPSGAYKLAKKVAPGKYYAKTGALTVASAGTCLAVKSRNVAVG